MPNSGKLWYYVVTLMAFIGNIWQYLKVCSIIVIICLFSLIKYSQLHFIGIPPYLSSCSCDISFTITLLLLKSSISGKTINVLSLLISQTLCVSMALKITVFLLSSIGFVKSVEIAILEKFNQYREKTRNLLIVIYIYVYP